MHSPGIPFGQPNAQSAPAPSIAQQIAAVSPFAAATAPRLNIAKPPTPTFPVTVREIQEAFVGVEGLVPQIRFVDLSAMIDFNQNLAPGQLEAIQRRAALVSGLRMIEFVQARRGSRNLESHVPEASAASLRIQLAVAQRSIERFKATLAKITDLAGKISTPISDDLARGVADFAADFPAHLEPADRNDPELFERAQTILAYEQARASAAFINYSQMEARIRFELERIEAADSNTKWAPADSSLLELSNAELAARHAQVKAELDDLDKWLPPVGLAISEGGV